MKQPAAKMNKETFDLAVALHDLKMNKNEKKEIMRIFSFIELEKEYAQRAADIWMRSAPTDAAKTRRQAAVKLIGLSDVITFQ